MSSSTNLKKNKNENEKLALFNQGREESRMIPPAKGMQEVCELSDMGEQEKVRSVCLMGSPSVHQQRVKLFFHMLLTML